MSLLLDRMSGNEMNDYCRILLAARWILHCQKAYYCSVASAWQSNEGASTVSENAQNRPFCGNERREVDGDGLSGHETQKIGSAQPWSILKAPLCETEASGAGNPKHFAMQAAVQW